MTLEQEIHEITQIPIRALRKYDLREFSVDERMSWVAGRRTTVKEDKAYCLLGIFDVFLPLIYGEGEEHAFRRLRKEIQGQAESLDSLTAAKAQKVTVSSHLPFPRNEFFVGREDHLRILEERLCPSHTHRRMSIYGLGGGGKTAVALELAYRMMAKHSPFLVLWVPAISRETFEIAYREIGILLCIPGITDYNADVKQLVKNSLNSGDFGDWLMVVDNADDPNVLLDSTTDDPRAGRLYDYLPCSDRGSIVFTTRDRKAAERLTQSSVLELEDMTKAEAKQLMARRIMKGTLLDDQSATNELLELLTYLPLAIVQAVAFINSNQVSISDYVSLFKRVDTEVEILSERFEDPSRYQETESTIARTWQISFDQILKQDQLAAGYLSFMACIDHINIPQSLLPVEGTAVQRLKALGTLTGYAFIAERQQNSQQVAGGRLFNVHRLVQKATVWWLKEHDDWTAWTETACGRLEELVPYGGHEGRSIWISYLPHVIHIADLCNTLSEKRRASLLDRIGRCQATLGQYAAAEETHRRVLSLRRKNVGNEEASTLTSMNEVGLALNSQGKYEEAETMHRQTLALKEKVLGKEHPSTLASMNNLAGVLDCQGKYEEAETMYRQTLVLREKVLSKEHPDTLLSVYYLAHLLAKRDSFVEATALYQRACEGYSVVFRDDHPTARACRRHYLEMLQRKEQSELISTSEASRTVPSNKKSVSEDGSGGSQMHRTSRQSRGLAKLRIRALKHEK